MLRRRAEARWRITADDVADLAELQFALLRAAATWVRPGGQLIYSVCTWTRSETVDLLERALPEGFDIDIDVQPPWRPWGSGVLLAHDATDGMFMVRMVRR